MRLVKLAVFVALPLSLACSTSSNLVIRSSHAEGVSFRDIETFRMATHVPSEASHPRLDRLAGEVIEGELKERGFVRPEVGPPDVRVEYEIGSYADAVPQIDRTGSSQAETRPIAARGYSRSGTLIVRFLDPRTGDTLWEGRATGLDLDPLMPEKKLRKAAWRILTEFPPLGS